MSKITCKLFGNPQILKDGQPIFFPYSKLNALLYYILVTKVVSRDEVADLLWPDENGDAAKRNLRNAIYQTKKALGADIILSPKKSLLILNDNLDLTLDVDQFMAEPQENLSLYAGEFLQGFFLKRSETYEYWIVKMRNYYKEKFFAECIQRVEADIQNGQYDQAETYIRRLMELDEYDERALRLLMRLYQETGCTGKVIEAYYEFSKLLRWDLGISPDQATKEIYERALEQIHLNTQPPVVASKESFFYERHKEIAALDKALKDFKEKPEGGEHILITGEPGSGRSTILKHRVLNRAPEDFFLIQTQGFPAEQELSLRPWYRLTNGLLSLLKQTNQVPPSLWRDVMCRVFPDFKDNRPEADYLLPSHRPPLNELLQIVIEAVRLLAAQRPLLLVVENIQWLDADSLRLLTSVLLETSRSHVILVATCTLERNQALRDAMAALNAQTPLMVLQLQRFTVETCHSFIKKIIPSQAGNGSLLEQLYSESEGNPFLLNEYIGMLQRGEPLDTMSPAVQTFLRGQLLYLSRDDLELAETLSYFYDGASLSLAARILGKDEAALVTSLENMIRRGIVKEEQGKITFSHSKLREYLYQAQPDARKQVRHRTIGLLLEEELAHSRQKTRLYSLLTYHFTKAGELQKALNYQLSNLNYRLAFSHEIFPVVKEEEPDLDPAPYISRDRIDMLFHNLETDLQTFRASQPYSEEIELLGMKLRYMKGRYSILEGQYEDGVANITHVIEQSKQLQRTDYTLDGYKQMIFYFIQIDDPKGMERFITLALELAAQCNNHKEIAVFLRLKGLYHMMIGNYGQAEKLLSESIHMLTITEGMAKSYTVNIAASYQYMGEIRMAEENYPEALRLFSKAISLCPGNALSSLSVFYTTAGRAAFFQKNYLAAQEYLQKAYALYGQFDSLWRRPTLDAYLALTLVEQGQLEAAKRHLETAQKNMWQMKNPSDEGAVYFAQTLIHRRADQDPELQKIFGALLPKSARNYGRLALDKLNRYLDRPELRWLHTLFADL